MHHKRHLCALSLTLGSGVPALGGGQTVGLFINEPEAAPGYTLFSPNGYDETFLVDVNGQLVNAWQSNAVSSNSYYLLENGHLMRLGVQGRVGEFDWDGTLLWSFQYSSPSVRAHHDIERLPNGNVLLVAWESKTAAEAIAAGRDPG